MRTQEVQTKLVFYSLQSVLRKISFCAYCHGKLHRLRQNICLYMHIFWTEIGIFYEYKKTVWSNFGFKSIIYYLVLFYDMISFTDHTGTHLRKQEVRTKHRIFVFYILQSKGFPTFPISLLWLYKEQHRHKSSINWSLS